ncbi:MAG TPA: TRAP transporter large permease subunit [Burkholderiales bacterium]|nr:TRAP transporter large permease subunit [Burkholderiales bacterium]
MLKSAEDIALSAALVALAALPLGEIALRAAFGTGISGAASFTQHCGLVAGMLGAAIAARDKRLLSLSTFNALLSVRAAGFARAFTGLASVVVGTLLTLASTQLVLAEKAGGNTIAYGIPVWLGQAALPAGLAVITLHLATHATPRPWGRVACLAIGVATATVAASVPQIGDIAVGGGLALLALAAILGAPVFVVLGGSALLLFWGDGLPIASVSLDHYRLVVNPSLPMIPLFTLAGYLLAESGAPRRLIRVFNALFAGLRGSAAIVTVLACMFFTCFSGASGVTIIALGGMLMPLLRSAGYSPKHALGLLAGAGSLGGLLPPGLPLVIYAIVAGISIQQMFLAGIVPALLLVALVGAWGVRVAPMPAAGGRRGIDWREARAAIADAKWELLLPIVAFAGLFSGLATPVEAAALTVAYAFVVEAWVHRDIRVRRDLPRIAAECGLLVGGILLILGVALGLTNYLVDARVPERAVEWVTNAIESRWGFLLALNLFLLAAGCVLDIFSATILLVPLIAPLGTAYGIDPIHLGVIFLVNMELGYLTPPVGMNLFFTAYRFDKPLPEVFRAALPVASILAMGLGLVTALPWLATGLPRLMQ